MIQLNVQKMVVQLAKDDIAAASKTLQQIDEIGIENMADNNNTRCLYQYETAHLAILNQNDKQEDKQSKT